MIDEKPPRLDAYRRKRDPDRTPEPFGGGRSGEGGLFVVQQHRARRLHYDFRLEMEGVLKSWAVPRGPSVRPEVKRLAVQVEDHPLEYADFEGVIPKDNYGAGAVIVWDHGRYRPAKPEGLLTQLARGLVEVELDGHKLRGRWTLARMGQGRDWLLIRKAGEAVPPVEATERYPRSVRSGLTLEEMRDAGAVRDALRARLRQLGAPGGAVRARDQGFMLASPAERAPEGADWIFEIKYDGIRVLAERRGDAVALVGRSGRVVTDRYPEVVAALRALAFDRFLIDGEIVAPDARGAPSFQRLQARMGLTRPGDVARGRVTVPVQAVFFDCLALEGHDLRQLPLGTRKTCLERVLPPLGRARYGDHVEGSGEAVLEAAAQARLEGIVAKRLASAYAAGRSDAWLKIKCHRRQEFVIGGYTDPQGRRARFGALHVGLYEGDRLVYVSRVGTGFDQTELDRLWQRLRTLRRPTSPFTRRSPAGRGHHWVEPRLVCEVRYTEWTRDGGLRHPAYLGLRDRRPADCRREVEEPAGPPPRAPQENAPPGAGREAAEPAGEARGAGDGHAPPRRGSRVRLTNLEKVLWPADGYTKGDLIAYHDAIAPRLLPYLRDRPIVLTRYPDGIAGKSFFQKDAPGFAPGWLRTARVYSKDTDRDIDYFVVNDAEALRYVVNLATIPIHVWSARVPALERPDWLVLDLDPKGAPFTAVVLVAQALHRLLDELEVPCYAKTSGATGLHVLVPMAARYTHEQARNLARLLATLVVEAAPAVATLARPLGARAGKVYVDFGQNGHGRTIVAPFSVRPLPGAPVSCPLDWDEVTPRLDPARLTIRTVPRRFAGRADPLAAVLGPGIEMAAVLARLEERLGR